MEKKEEKKQPWFWRWFLNNKVVTGLLVVTLLLLILLLFTKVSYLFTPIWQFVGIVGLPILLAGILFYFLNPIVDFVERRGVKRVYSIVLLFIMIATLLVLGVAVIIPNIHNQFLSFVSNFPSYGDTINGMINKLDNHHMLGELSRQLENVGDDIIKALGETLKNISKSTVQGIGSLVDTVATIFVAIVTMPIILFYLLRDGKELVPYFMKFLPTKWRKSTLEVLTEMNNQVSSYIRGQLTVAAAVAIIFMVGFSAIKLDYAVVLGITAGLLNLIPYLGSFLAMIPAVFIALASGSFMLVKLAIVFVIEQTIEGRFISPLVLGSKLAIHPVTILIVLLTSGKLFGVVGVILGIPCYAAAKVVITHVFEWYKTISNLYEERV